MLEELRFEKQLTLIYLEGCTVACRHCVTNSAPGLKQKLPLELAKKIMSQARAGGYEQVHISGGEPFIIYDTLRELIRQAKHVKQTISITSNAFWATSLEKAIDKLMPLKEDGLDKLHLSYDEPHREEGIPVTYLENGVRAAQMIDLPVALWLAFFRNDQWLHELKLHFEKYEVEFRISNVEPLGRAKKLNKQLFYENRQEDLYKGCNTYELLVVGPNGNCYACCNALTEAMETNPLFLGNAFEEPFEEILRKKEKLIIHELISYFGPKTLYDLLPPSMRRDLSPDLHLCQFCTIMLNSEERVNFLSQRIKERDGKLAVKLALLEALRNRQEGDSTRQNDGELIKRSHPALR